MLGWLHLFYNQKLFLLIIFKLVSPNSCMKIHYYKNVDLSRLGNPCCPGFPTGNASSGQKGVLFCPGSGNRDKRGHFVLVGNTNRDKRCSQRPRGWRTLLSRLVLPIGTKCLFFFMFFFSQFFFYFNYTFAFQLNLCIGIQCVWSLLIYTYIYSYVYNIFPR